MLLNLEMKVKLIFFLVTLNISCFQAENIQSKLADVANFKYEYLRNDESIRSLYELEDLQKVKNQGDYLQFFLPEGLHNLLDKTNQSLLEKPILFKISYQDKVSDSAEIIEQREIISTLAFETRTLVSRQTKGAKSAYHYLNGFTEIMNEPDEERKFAQIKAILPKSAKSLQVLDCKAYLINDHPFISLKYRYQNIDTLDFHFFEQKFITWYNEKLYTFYFQYSSKDDNYGQYVGLFSSVGATIRFNE